MNLAKISFFPGSVFKVSLYSFSILQKFDHKKENLLILVAFMSIMYQNRIIRLIFNTQKTRIVYLRFIFDYNRNFSL